MKLTLLVTLTLKTPLKKALFAVVFDADVSPVISTDPAAPGTMLNGQGFVGGVPVGLGSASGGGHFVGSMITVTRPAASDADATTSVDEPFVTSTPRTTPEPPGVAVRRNGDLRVHARV